MMEELERIPEILRMFGGIGGEHSDVAWVPGLRNKDERDHARGFEGSKDAD